MREKILEYLIKANSPQYPDKIIEGLGLTDVSEIKKLLAALRDLEKEGEVYVTKAGKYGLPEQMNMVRGKIQGHPKGFAFLIPEDREKQDVFISPLNLKGAMHNDRVLVRYLPFSDGNRPEGEVVKILERANKTVVGSFYRRRHYGLVEPDDERITGAIIIPLGKKGIKAENGEKVVVEITAYPRKGELSEGKIIEILGDPEDPQTRLKAIIKKYGLLDSFKPETIKEARAISQEIGPEELKSRRDLRGEMIVTIDDEDAKDLDDAVSLKKLPNGNYQLGVHIADVSYYVREGSALDKEALERGTSVYLAGKVLPMLPPELSNGICSLNPRVDRLTLSVVMEITPTGEVVSHEIFPSVIKTRARLTYTIVKKAVLDKDPKAREELGDLVPMLEEMANLAMILRKRRLERGAIDFDLPEAKVILDDKGEVVDIVRRERNIAHQLIEEFMLITNETVAERFFWQEVPFLYRIHEDPDEGKIQSLKEFLRLFGYNLKGGRDGKYHPREFQRLLEKVAGRKEERVINAVMLRSMKQARYSAERIWHFGLAAEYYTHFTSPIRRYPDLMIHRIIREVLEGKLTPRREAKLAKILPKVAKHSSEMERRAMEAERESVEMRMVEFMAGKEGTEYDAIISGVTSYGFFVQLPNLIEGLVRVSTLEDDYYLYDEKSYALIGRRTKKVFRLGDEVRVRLVKVNTVSREIDFVLVKKLGKSPETNESAEEILERLT
ncbi:ribonuclease R [Carboxydothermus ferrireducens]|uniref:Ribonuclease R n=1 Tax=Carboxydothermus ferrireducens DSM 11255 TaxID=1119529 RepID=A0ABX2R7Z9_9THEO|nr:ribonuclease R [Carboxydothermus ferrireducens]NYE57306.1 ribonuclease R [Carboxydothermus ferrireducens DSM 11255]